MVPAQAEMENKMSEMLQCCKAEHPDNPREELEITGIGTGIIGTKIWKGTKCCKVKYLENAEKDNVKISAIMISARKSATYQKLQYVANIAECCK